ncbi:MAG TPA: HDIG domain-containing protein [Ignavibacteria bacterium]|nr:HDIG domain-containing protein [Ignavibacteria bacterium]HQY51890.1 HDIG domain-containing protein [Ignavibacteria bacterium]HRB00434.1 HDIG domain-containing protein [Ignavibacteria bacterium]
MNLKDKFSGGEFLKQFSRIDLKTSSLIKLFIAIITVTALFLMIPSYKNIESKYEVGAIWSSEDLIAPFSFPVYKDESEYDQEKKDVIKNIALVFDKDDSEKNISDSLENLRREMTEVFEITDEIIKNNEGFINSEKLDVHKAKIGIDFTFAEWEQFYSIYKNLKNSDENKLNISFPEYLNIVSSVVLKNSDGDIINLDKNNITSKKITVQHKNDKLQELSDLDKVKDKNEILFKYESDFKNKFSDSLLVSSALKISNKFTSENLIYNNELTEKETQSRIEQIPKTIGIVKENERIISKHDPVNRFTKMKLDSYKKVRLEKIGTQDVILQYVGKFFTVIILLIVLGFFLYYIRPAVFNDNFKLMIISSMILIEGFIAFLSMSLDLRLPIELLIFVPVASILLTIIFDSRLAFYTVTIICFFVATIRGGDFSIAFITFCGSVLAIFSERDIKNRSQIFRSFFFILIGYTISILAVNLIRIEDYQKLWVKLMFGGINAVMSPVIAFGLLIFYEKVFKITTDLTLLELSDFNHPLLKELSSKAPGTFHHSIIMGNLSEAAAEAIGANQILARVGCYYHDIGKIMKPQYFIENQLDEYNKHNELNPTVSTKIIIAHVTDGIALAKKYKLPQEIIDFIPMHHGTTLVSYFYDKAKKSTKEELSDYIYRYPGPKPQTKETGIVMLADAIEASTRAIEDPTPQKLESKIREVIKVRFMEGEFDECDLTLRDLTHIKDSFMKVLIGIHHHRIKYPDKNQLELVSNSSE